jgi:hypothetical protein
MILKRRHVGSVVMGWMACSDAIPSRTLPCWLRSPVGVQFADHLQKPCGPSCGMSCMWPSGSCGQLNAAAKVDGTAITAPALWLPLPAVLSEFDAGSVCLHYT